MFGLSGCSLLSFDSVQDPEVHLLKVQVVKARLTQQDFKLYFEVDNPNDSDLFVRGLNYKISLNDVVLADDQFSDWFSSMRIAGKPLWCLFVPTFGGTRNTSLNCLKT